MKKFFTFLGAIFFIAIIAGSVFFFAFDKKIPAGFVDSKIKGISSKVFLGDDFTLEKINSGVYKCTQTVTTESSSIENFSSFKKKGSGDSLTFDVNVSSSETKMSSKYYIEDGKYYYEQHEEGKETKEILEKNLWEISIKLMFLATSPYDIEGKLIQADLIENNIASVTQKGLFYTVHSKKDNTSVDARFLLNTDKIYSLKIKEETYVANKLIESVLTKYEVSYY